jgi:hypothetical protein
MPREYVHGSEGVLMEPLPEEGSHPVGARIIGSHGQLFRVLEEGLVSVSWGDEQEHVQVSTLTRVPETFETKQEGPYIDLDRRGINDLIRHLRRARDRAYGRDE